MKEKITKQKKKMQITNQYFSTNLQTKKNTQSTKKMKNDKWKEMNMFIFKEWKKESWKRSLLTKDNFVVPPSLSNSKTYFLNTLPIILNTRF